MRSMETFIAKAKTYLDERRGERVTLDQLAGAVGASPFHLQRRFKEAFGVSPRDYQDAYRIQAGLCSLKLGAEKKVLKKLLEEEFGEAELLESALPELRRGILEFLRGDAQLAKVPVDIRGTVFQRKVWAELCRIPRGETRTYAQIA